MNPKKIQICGCGAMMVMMLLTACGKKADAPAPVVAEAQPMMAEVVPAAERSRHFEAVNSQLELGGTLYGYMDIDGDVLKLAGELQKVFQEIARTQPEVEQLQKLAGQDFSDLAQMLGLADIKAMGVSSVAESDGYYRNRAYLHTGPSRRGLLAGLGGKPGPFRHVSLAPADTSFYSEAEMDMAAIYRTVREVIAKAGGEQADKSVEAALKRAGEAAALSLIDLFNGFKGHVVVVLRVDEVKTWELPQVRLPTVSLLLRVDGIASQVERALARSPAFVRSDTDGLRIYAAAQPTPLAELQPVIVIDGGALYISTNVAFFNECRNQRDGLVQNEEFKAALARVGNLGNGLTYVSPRLSAQVRRVESLNPQLPVEAQRMMGMVIAQIPETDQPMIATRTNLTEGILITSYLNRSLKQDLIMVAAYNPVTVGLLAAMAIPAFQKVRMTSQEKAVLNNLRQFAAAGDQFCLERGVAKARYADLVGPGRYIRKLESVAGEDYTGLVYEIGGPLAVKLHDGRVVRYDP